MNKPRLPAIALPAIILTGLLTGCQWVQDSAREVRSTFDQTVENTRGKAGQIQQTIDQQIDSVTGTVEEIKQKVDETKDAIGIKMQQLDEAGQKIDQAKQAIGDANQAIQDLTR